MRRLSLLALSLMLSACSSLIHVPPAERKAVIVSLDGAGERVIERMIERGVMPHLAKLQAEGVWADYSRTNYPAKTAAGHASLWTGTYANHNGITSNHIFPMPLRLHGIDETTDAFASTELLAEPLYVSAARAGKRVVALQATHLTPFSTYDAGGRYGGPFKGSMALIDGFDGVRGAEAVFKDPAAFKPASGWAQLPSSAVPPREASLTIGQSTFYALAYDDAADGTQGYDTVALFAAKDAPAAARLKPSAQAGWSAALPIKTKAGEAKTYFRLFALAPDLGSWMLYHTVPTVPLANRPEVVPAAFEDRTFIKGGAMRVWAAGALGPTMFKGGDGAAEARYRDTVSHMLDETALTSQRLLKRRDWDLFIHYLPFPDEALHGWYGAVDDASPSYDPLLAPRVWSELEGVCSLVDGYIGRMRASLGPDTVFAVVSDHGMAGLKWTFNPNVVLKRAGLLAVDAKGKLDLARTQVIVAPTGGAFLSVNRIGRKGGIVPESDVPKVLAAAEAALRTVKAHDGTPLVTSLLRQGPEAEELGAGGVRGGDLYMDVKPGYYISSDWKSKEVFEAMPPGSGNHMYDPRRPDMHAILGLAGPGLKRGVVIPAVRTIDLAPTVSALLGMPAPAQATGRVLTEALAP